MGSRSSGSRISRHDQINRDFERERMRHAQPSNPPQGNQPAAVPQKGRERSRSPLIYELRKHFDSDFLGAESFFKESCTESISEEEFEAEKIHFVRKWIEDNAPKLDGTKHLLDDEQIRAVAAVNGNIQVVARAGSGKTTTLVFRVIFLVKHCRVFPTEILVLAFNRKAALEVRKRLLLLLAPDAASEVATEIARRIKDAGGPARAKLDELEAAVVDATASRRKIMLPHVMTFHALGYAIVHPEEGLLYDDPLGESQELSRAFQQVIDDHLRQPLFRDKIRELMLAHFREDWERIAEGRHDKSKDEFLKFRRALPRESLGGEYVKSYGEKIIADFLFEHDIAYKYERNHWWGGINYRPDFTIFFTPATGLIIEYFGLSGDADYDQMSEDKRAYWKSKAGWTLLEFSPQDISGTGVNAFLELLATQLREHGCSCTKLSEDEIWNRISDRAIDRFTTASVGFVGRCRKQSISVAELKERMDSYSSSSPVEEMFLGVVHSLFDGYLERLRATGEEDFDGLMQRATEAVDSGITCFQRKSGSGDLRLLKHICIDEFQDFSDLFYRLLLSIRRAAPSAELFCVGDDWQAINGFAGSDLRFYQEFEVHFGNARQLYISTNYRSSASIVCVGNALMSGLGKPAIAKKRTLGKVLVSDLGKFEPSLIEKQRHPGDILTPAVLRLVNSALKEGSDVVMLSRRNGLPWFVNFDIHNGGSGRGLARYLDLIRSYFPRGLRERINISTAHKYKGLEKPRVIVLDLVARSYPLIHPDWSFYRILGDSPEKIIDEERRLLYVAMTRAIESLVLITEGRSESPFLLELKSATHLDSIDWAGYTPVRGLTNRLVVKIGNQQGHGGAPTYSLRDLLKASGYQWQSQGWQGWAKSFPVDSFKSEILQKEVWSQSASNIEVRILDDSDLLLARFMVDNGKWTCLMNNVPSDCVPNDNLQGDSEKVPSFG